MLPKVAKIEYSGDVLKEITNGRPYGFDYLTGEAKELWDEIMARRWAGAREELSDTAYAANMLAHQTTGLNLPMIGGHEALAKFRRRNAIWKRIMEDRGVPFSVDYLTGGSNYHKPAKIQHAFSLAGKQISDKEAQKLAEEAIKMEINELPETEVKKSAATGADNELVKYQNRLAKAVRGALGRLTKDEREQTEATGYDVVGNCGHMIQRSSSVEQLPTLEVRLECWACRQVEKSAGDRAAWRCYPYAMPTILSLVKFAATAGEENPNNASDLFSSINSSYAPLSNLGGAASGALPGAAVGGILGLVRSALGGEGIGGSLKGALGGAALGGLTGAGLGMGGAWLTRKGLTQKLLQGAPEGASEEEIAGAGGMIDVLLRRVHAKPGDVPGYLWNRFAKRDENAGNNLLENLARTTGQEALLTGGAATLPMAARLKR
jgi:hypothetical protein